MRSRRPGLFRLLTAAGAALALSVGGVLATASAQAATGGAVAAPRSGAAVKTAAAMREVRVTGLVSGTPDKNGDVWVRLADGAKVPIPAVEEAVVMWRAAREAGTSASPDNTVTSSCGSSYLFLSEKSDDHPVRMTTGFTVTAPAISYGWGAGITGPSFSDTYSSAGALAKVKSWNGSFDSPLDQLQGTYKAAVVPDLSFAVLADGTFCSSLGPSDTKFLTSPDTPVSWALSTAGPADSSALTPALAAPPVAAEPPAGHLRKVKNTTVSPFSAVALLHITYRDGSSSKCTGFLYAANIVATAGHCLYGKDGYAERVEVVPGQYGKKRQPFGACLGTTAFSVTGFIPSGNRAYDYGAVKLNCTIGDRTGWFSMLWTSTSLAKTKVTVAGYPETTGSQDSMWTSSGTILSSTLPRQLFFAFDIRDGDAGAPLYTPGGSGYVALGVVAYPPSKKKLDCQATRITQAAFDNYQLWKA